MLTNEEIRVAMTSVPRMIATQREWEDLAQLDPLWAILSNNEKQFRKWEQEEFFGSGQLEIDALMSSCRLAHGNNGRVLDFGCGVGRLTRALQPYFAEVYGVDISGEMIRLAREYTPSCTFLLNREDNLSLFQNDFFDFIYSNIVLQHQSNTQIVKSYIQEFVRIIKPEGIVVFQLPYKLTLRYRLQPRRRLYSLLKTIGVSTEFLYNRLHLSPMRTICLPSQEVNAAVSAAGGRVVRSYSDHFNHHSMSYAVTKDASISGR
jgi:2-polyprenyl-3-methyl-5-hydroxy-6-metoxy-1,4-benzoquinol methylase